MARFKRFGEVVINLDQVVKVVKDDEEVKVHLAGTRVEPPATSSTMAFVGGSSDRDPRLQVFKDRQAVEVWAFFTSTSEL